MQVVIHRKGKTFKELLLLDQLVVCENLEGWDGVGTVGGRFKREGIHVYLWLIYTVIWQKSMQRQKQLSSN